SEEHLRIALEAGAMGTWEWRPTDGRVTWSESLERIHGLEPGSFGGTFEDFRRDIHPEDRDRVLGEIRRVVEGGAAGYAIEYRIVRPDGRTRWLAASATVIREGEGAVLRLVGVCTDVTDRKEAERRLVAQHAVAAALAEAESVGAATPKLLAGVGEALGFDVGAVYLVDPDAERLRCAGTWVREDRDVGRFAEVTRGFSPARGEGLPGMVWQRGEPVWIEDFATDPRMPRGPVAAEEQLHAAIAFPMRAGGELIGVLELLGRDFRQPDGELARLLDAVGNQIGLVVARRRAEEARADLLEKERVAREAAEEANERLAFLAGAGITFTSSLDYRWTLAEVARLAVPRIADWCAVELVEPDGTISEVELAHVDPERVALARELRRRWPPPPDAPTGVPHVIRTREPELHPEITDEMVTATIDDPERLALVRRLGLRSLMIVPMVARGRAIGAITFATSDDSGRRFDEQDLSFVGHLARRAALSIDNARLFEERARIASTLQRSLLPPTLPSVPGVEAAAAYQAAAVEHNDVGGDFYDLFERGDDTWVAAIGDVGGKGVEAAALTGLLRHTIRADALHAASPAEVLERLNAGLLRQGADRFCTVALAFVRPDEGGARVTVACAGHPPPVVVRAGGAVEPVEAAGTVLGVLDEVTVEDRDLELGAGDALVLFTDGLLDPRRSDPIDEDGLASLLARDAGLDARSIADRLAAAVEDPAAAPDDVAILVLRATPRGGAA
ncbi:MAG TPA: SpoIIE family protein phosphatase, partial [Actinomycetota bacterium]